MTAPLINDERTFDALCDIVERIMTQHWDMWACNCWVCTDARALGCRPREVFLHEKRTRVKCW